MVQVVQPNSLTEVSLEVGSLSGGGVLGLEVTLNTDITINSTVYFTTVFQGELHSWSLLTARERIVTKYLCGLSQSQDQVKCQHAEYIIMVEKASAKCYSKTADWRIAQIFILLHCHSQHNFIFYSLFFSLFLSDNVLTLDWRQAFTGNFFNIPGVSHIRSESFPSVELHIESQAGI